ncbi:site-specific integrase [Polynucleobacter sp. AP-Reno-20A-A9]|uniref:tyrosine-type recombinase/integrase n=1 Tax=Polynucleobacter sp. AP-Reno-20A-A9 TaxID=2576925 RepID=UPI001C0B654A|nr:site-specific integrase [Polynucleobacter sp. AP-Reno-20A-A9]MBU3627710.1 site-specific integrase [Polynucleobacter sp. AP-Reno-20A-A9]
MAQAKTLTTAELEQLLRYISSTTYPERNRAMLLMGYWAGLRVKEIAQLKMGDVLNEDGTIKSEIRLSAQQTKGNDGRTVFLPAKLKEELAVYLKTRHITMSDIPLFHTSKRLGWTPNTLCQHFFWLYKKAGIAGASSHSGRRQFITTLANKGISVRILASLAGHKSIAVTQKYIDVNDDMKRAAVELI